MRIAFITLMGGLPWGGSEVLWSKTAKLAIEQGLEVAVSGYDWGNKTHEVYQELNSLGAKVYMRPRFSHSMRPLKKIQNYIENRNPKLKMQWKFLRSFKPDHVLINQGGCFDLIQHHFDLYQLLQRNSISYSILSHSHPQFSYIPETSIYLKGKEVFINARNTFFISDRQKRFVEKALLIKLENDHFTWNPLNLETHEILEWPTDNIINFAMVGGLVTGKGHDIAFEFLSTPIWKERIWKLNVYGTGYGEQYLRELAEFYKISDRVEFHGHVSSATEIWKKNHILLMPSSGEGMPITMIEALICGRPVVATDVGGIREVIQEGENGFVSKAPTVESFSNALEIGWGSKAKLKLMGKTASEYRGKISNDPEKIIIDLLSKI